MILEHQKSLFDFATFISLQVLLLLDFLMPLASAQCHALLHLINLLVENRQIIIDAARQASAQIASGVYFCPDFVPGALKNSLDAIAVVQHNLLNSVDCHDPALSPAHQIVVLVAAHEGLD